MENVSVCYKFTLLTKKEKENNACKCLDTPRRWGLAGTLKEEGKKGREEGED